MATYPGKVVEAPSLMSILMKKPFNILWLIPDSTNYLYHSYVNALRRLGCSVTLFYYRDRLMEVGGRQMRDEILRGLPSAPGRNVLLASLYGQSYELTPEFLRELGRQIPVAIWSVDDEIYCTSQTVYLAQTADAVITTDYWGRGVIEQIGVPTIYFPCPSLDFADAKPNTRKTIDVSFVGNCLVSDRMHYIDHLERNDIPVETFGRGSKNGYISREKLREVMSASRINLNFSKMNISKEVLRQETWRQHVRQIKGRPLEVAAMGGFCLSEYASHLGRVLEVGKEVDVFWSTEQLLDKVKYYLAQDEERERIAHAAYLRVQKEWGPLQGLAGVLNELDRCIAHVRGHRGENLPLVKSVAYREAEVENAVRLAASLLRRRRIRFACELMVDSIFPFRKGTVSGLVTGMRRVVERLLGAFLKTLRALRGAR